MNRVIRIARVIPIALALAAGATAASAQDPARAQAPGARGGGGRGGVAVDTTEVAGLLREIERSYAVALRTFPNEPVVRDAPYSGVGTTMTTQVLSDGTRIDRSTTTRVWRDRMGRVRREQTAVGLGALSPANDTTAIVTISDPVAGRTYTLDPAMRTARSAAFAVLRTTRVIGGAQGQLPFPANVPVEALGTRDIEGIKAVGRRTTTTMPLGQIGNDRPFDVTYEQWESPELQILLQSRQNDPRTGVVEYRLTALTRAEPPPDLFTVPSDYTVIAQPGLYFRSNPTGRTGAPPAPAAPAAPGGVGGGRRGRSNSVDQFLTPDGK